VTTARFTSAAIPPGTKVEFRGGTGRDDVEVSHRGIVNGEAVTTGRGVLIPVHVPDTNHNVMVAAENITRIVSDDDRQG
jgi:hypothetical protein